MALKYAGPLNITEITGSNTVRVVDEKDASEEILRVSHLKPYNDEMGEEVDDAEVTQQPREETSVPVTSDPPEVGGAPPSAAERCKSSRKASPGAPAKNGSRRETSGSA